MKCKVKYLLTIICAVFALTSCDFNIKDKAGPQMSFSVQESKSHGTFLAEYVPRERLINGLRINSVFIEKKFCRKDGFLLQKEINCCQSQLVIITDDGLLDYGNEWVVRDFTGARSSYSMYKDLEGTALPDSILVEVIAIHDGDSSEVKQRLALHRVINPSK